MGTAAVPAEAFEAATYLLDVLHANGGLQPFAFNHTHAEDDEESTSDEDEDDEDDEDEDEDDCDCDCCFSCGFCSAHFMGKDFTWGGYLDWCRCERCWQATAAENPNCMAQILDQLYRIDEHESVYVREQKPSRYLTGLAVDYDRCTVAELKRFTQDRGLPFPRIPFKVEYIKILAKADREATFRFMDLPAEMRNEVYEYLLVLPGGNPDCNNCDTSILQTCKEIYDEAKSILYEENTVECSFWVKPVTFFSSYHAIHIHNSESIGYVGIDTEVDDSARHTLLPSGLDAYPEFLRRIRHLKLDIRFERGETVQSRFCDCFQLESAVVTFSSFLMDEHCLQSLEVCVNLEIGPALLESFEAAARMLYPLRRIRGIPAVRIIGNIPDSIRAKLVEDMQSSERCFNTVKHWKNLMDEAQAMDGLLRALGQSHYYNSATGDLYELQLKANEAFLCREKEERFQAALHEVSILLRKVDLKKLQVTLKQLVKCRQDRLYDANRVVGNPLQLAYDKHGSQEIGDEQKIDYSKDWGVII